MRGPSATALLLGPALAGAVTLRSQQVASADISLSGKEPSSHLNFRLHVYESEDPCDPANVTIAGVPLPEGGNGVVSLGSGLEAQGHWETSCDGYEQQLVLSLDSIPAQGFDHVEFTITFQQVAPVYISEIIHSDATYEDDEGLGESTKEAIDEELKGDIDELMSLRHLQFELMREIRMKEDFLDWMEMTESAFEGVGSADNAPECKGLWCLVMGVFDKLTGLHHPGRGRWPHRGCGNHTHGNHTRGNHTFPHPPWWRHRPGNNTHGNHTHDNHTFPYPPPWWRHPHGNHTHGNHTHPPFHRRPPFFCRPHGKPPHHKPPHHKPPHHKPPHHKPPHGQPPHDKPPFFEPPTGFPHIPSQRPIRFRGNGNGNGDLINTPQPAGLRGFLLGIKPFFKLGISVAFFSLLVIALHARCRARRAGVSWAERREARRRACRAKRAAMKRRWIALLDRLRPEEESEDYCEKSGMLEEVYVAEKNLSVFDEEEVKRKDEDGEAGGMTMSQDLALFRHAAQMVGEMVAAEESRTRRE